MYMYKRREKKYVDGKIVQGVINKMKLQTAQRTSVTNLELIIRTEPT